MGYVNRILSEFCATTGIAYETSASAAHIGEGETLPSRLAGVTELATGAVAAAAASAAFFARARGASPVVTRWEVDPRQVAASFRADQLLRLDGRAFPGFAELSGYFRTADGWLRTHANYPHHRRRLLAALGLPEDADRAALVARLGLLDAVEAEELVRAHQGIAAAVRTPEQWAAHPQSAVAATLPLVAVEALDDAPAEPRAYRGKLRDPALPMAGLRVLDLTRVIAGPVATRTLALLGADVLRVDDPHLPELASQHLDNGMGKRSTLLDLRDPADRRTFDALLEDADVVVTGYRPRALDGFGLAPRELAARRPGLVVATLDAWGPTGPWGGLRGFDSIVQAATGIAALTSPDGEKPGALPAQALDHASGYLLAAGVLIALNRQVAEGGTWHTHAHLARTAQALLSLGPHSDPATAPYTQYDQPDLDDCLREQATPGGLLRYPAPAFGMPARPFDYPSVGGVWGADAAAWRDGARARAGAPGS